MCVCGILVMEDAGYGILVSGGCGVWSLMFAWK